MDTYWSTMETVEEAVMFPAAKVWVRLAESGMAEEEERPALVENTSGRDRHLQYTVYHNTIRRCELKRTADSYSIEIEILRSTQECMHFAHITKHVFDFLFHSPIRLAIRRVQNECTAIGTTKFGKDGQTQIIHLTDRVLVEDVAVDCTCGSGSAHGEW